MTVPYNNITSAMASTTCLTLVRPKSVALNGYRAGCMLADMVGNPLELMLRCRDRSARQSR